MNLLQAYLPYRKPAEVPAAWRAAAKAKLERDRKSYAAFRAIDQALHEQRHKERVTAEVDKWAEEVRLYGLDIAEQEPEAAEALAAARGAEDRAREAAEYARTQRVEYERIRDGGEAPAEEETGALLRADAAEETARQRQQAAGEAVGASRQADEALAESREGLADAERRLKQAREHAKIPAGTAAISGWTIQECAMFMQSDEVWNGLTRQERIRVQQAIWPRDLATDEEIRAMFRQDAVQQGSVV